MDAGVRTRRTIDACASTAAPTSSLGIEFRHGDAIGDYIIDRELGRGGMGAVYAAVHGLIEKRVAIKVLRRELSNSDDAVNRFVQEARAVNRIRHEGIVDVFGYGTTDDGCCFLVMELLEGDSLGRYLRHAALGVPYVCDVLAQITYALEAAHAAGVVHRDLKPDNIFLVGSRVKLLDFGIAKLTTPTELAPTDYTQPGQAIGTPSYIAPEQACGVAVDGRTDVYSLGVVAFEMLVGRRPFESDNAMELIAHHITQPPPRPTELNPALPPVADALLLGMLAKDPAKRPSLARVRELLAELRAVPAPLPRRARWWIAGVGVATFAAACVVGWVLMADRDTSVAATVAPEPAPVQAEVKPAAPVKVEAAAKVEAPAKVEKAEQIEKVEAPKVEPPPVKAAPVKPVAKRVAVKPKVVEPPPAPPIETKLAPEPPPPPAPPKPPAKEDRDTLKGLHLHTGTP